jgi:hypothetical protein
MNSITKLSYCCVICCTFSQFSRLHNFALLCLSCRDCAFLPKIFRSSSGLVSHRKTVFENPVLTRFNFQEMSLVHLISFEFTWPFLNPALKPDLTQIKAGHNNVHTWSYICEKESGSGDVLEILCYNFFPIKLVY